MNNFNSDLKFGKKYEVEALNYFKYTKVCMSEGLFKGYDFILDDKIKVEVKADRMAQKTCNIAIEHTYKGYKSGITTTKAHYYVYFVEKCKTFDCYKIPVKKLRKIIIKNNCRSVKGGDFKNSEMYLLNIKYIKKYIVNQV